MPHRQRQGIALRIAVEEAGPLDGVDAGKQTGRMHAVGLFHQTAARGFREFFRHQGPTKDGRGGRQQVLLLIRADRHGLVLFADQDAVFQRVDAVAELGHLGVVGHHDHGDSALVAKGAEVVHDHTAGTGIKGPGGFVRQQDAGIVHHGAGNGHTLLLTTGKAVAAVMDAGGEPHQLQGPDDTLPAFRGGHVFIDEGEFHILEHGGVVEHIARLHDEPHVAPPESSGLLPVEFQDIGPQDLQRAGIGRMQHAQHVQHGRLAAPGRPHDGHEFPRFHLDVDATQNRRKARVALVQIFGNDNRRHSSPTRNARRKRHPCDWPEWQDTGRRPPQ